MKSKQFLPLALSLVLMPVCLQSPTNICADFGAAKAATPVKKVETKTPGPLSAASLVDVVTSAKVLAPQYPVHCALNGSEATVITVRNTNATDQDCKIDAVLLAKAIMDAYPKEIIRVKLLLSHAGDATMQDVSVTMGDVKAFATSTITKEQLLSSLELVSVPPKNQNQTQNQTQTASAGQKAGQSSTAAAPAVAPGPQPHVRQILAARIQNLKTRGIGTKPYEDMFAKIEEMVQQPASSVPRTDIQQAIRDLAGKLNEQEKSTDQAQDLAQGRGRAFRRWKANPDAAGTSAGDGSGNNAANWGGFYLNPERRHRLLENLKQQQGQNQ